MKVRLILFLVLLMLAVRSVYVSAGDIESSIRITEDKTIEYDKRELLAALYEADIESIREALDMKLITCRELVEYYLERIDEYNDAFNCFITICDNALSEADKRDAEIRAGTAEGSLFGIPIVVKDNIKYAGYYTTNGAKFENSSISSVNALIVKYLLNEGAIIIGKSNMSTSAQEARASRSKAVGETYNAYNTELASGGSSGGSAVAMSLNFGTASLGTDTNSSLRYPAALNGCVSLRPTTGLISKDGCIILNKRRDTAGAITRTVRDQAIMLDVITGGTTSYTENLNANVLSGMRIGVLKELTYAVDGMYNRTNRAIDDEIEATFANAVKELEACGATVIEVSLPDIFAMSAACDESEDGWSAAKNKYYAALQSLLADNNISAVIFPTYLSAPLYTGVNKSGGLVIYDQIWTSNCSVLASPIGIPEISVPIGTHSRGAGIGLEIATLKNNEQLLLDIAYSYTEQYDHRTAPGTAPDIYAEYDTGSLDDFIAGYKVALAEIERLKEEELREQETSTQEITTTAEEETTTEVQPDETSSETPVETAPIETTPAETTMPAETTPAETTSDDTYSESVTDAMVDVNDSDEDKMGRMLWIIFIMLILLVVVGNFIIMYYRGKDKRIT